MICSVDLINVERFEIGPGESALVYQFMRLANRERFRVGVEAELGGGMLFVWSPPVSVDASASGPR